MTPDKAKKVILVCVLGMVIITVAGDASEGKAPKPARFIALGFVILALVGSAELVPALAAALAMVAFVGVALERLGPIANRVAGVVGGQVPLGKLGDLAPATTQTSDPSTIPTQSGERPAPGNVNKGSKIVATAKRYIGVPYVWAGNGPTGFDCSGLTKWCYGRNKITIPRTAAAQQAAATKVSNPLPGDLVFFGSPAHHVGIYIGGGKMIDAPHTGAFVRVDDLSHRSVTNYGRLW